MNLCPLAPAAGETAGRPVCPIGPGGAGLRAATLLLPTRPGALAKYSRKKWLIFEVEYKIFRAVSNLSEICIRLYAKHNFLVFPECALLIKHHSARIYKDGNPPYVNSLPSRNRNVFLNQNCVFKSHLILGRCSPRISNFRSLCKLFLRDKIT